MPDSYFVELEKFILKGLVEEWHISVDLYGIETKGRFFCPLFSLSDSKSFLGQWSCLKYQISIQREFALKEDWCRIKSVLKHEIAHQYADLVLNPGRKEPPHGSSFKKACEILRISNKSFFNPNDDSSEEKDDEKIITKIKKLFSLAGSQNSNEAEQAMLKAHELMAKYNFEAKDLNNKVYFSSYLGKPALRHFKEFYHLAAFLSKFYFVYPVWVPCFVKEKGRTGRIIEITGERSNIEIASYIYDYILYYMNSSWEFLNNEKKGNRYEKTDFCIGLIDGFSSKLEKDREMFFYKQGDNLPVVVSSDPEIKSFLSWYYPIIRTSFKKSSLKKDFYDKGIEKGSELVISKGIEKNETLQKVYIEK